MLKVYDPEYDQEQIETELEPGSELIDLKINIKKFKNSNYYSSVGKQVQVGQTSPIKHNLAVIFL